MNVDYYYEFPQYVPQKCQILKYFGIMRTPVNYYGLAYQPCFEIVGWIGSKHADNSLRRN